MRWLTEYRLKTTLRLAAGETELRHLNKDFELFLRNTDVSEPDTEGEGLSARMVFEAGEFEDAERRSDELLEQFLDLLAFSTNVGARISKRTYLIDWTEGALERDQYLYGHALVDDPIELLSSDILRSVAQLEPVANRISLSKRSIGSIRRFGPLF